MSLILKNSAVYLAFTVSLIFFSIICHAVELKRGVVSGTDEWLAFARMLNDSASSFIESDTEGVVYSYNYGDYPSLGKSNIMTKELLQGTILQNTPPCELSDYNCNQKWLKENWWHGRWSSDEVLEKEIVDRLRLFYLELKFLDNGSGLQYTKENNLFGCLHHAPLRYGDINNDGINDIVVTFARDYSLDWLIFSTNSFETIFSTKLIVEEGVDRGAAEADLLPKAPEFSFQYVMRSAVRMGEGLPLQHSGLRSYAKLYFDDFDGDGFFDILVWRKLFESRLISDPIKGYSLIKETFVHYSFIDDKYSLMSSEESQIKGWLENKEKTWKSGYPANSECVGMEEQLIPEFHDTLLNDVAVLE